MIGNSNVTIKQGKTYTDAGARATDNTDGDITTNITVNNPVNITTLGGYVYIKDSMAFNIVDEFYFGNSSTDNVRFKNSVFWDIGTGNTAKSDIKIEDTTGIITNINPKTGILYPIRIETGSDVASNGVLQF